MLTVGFCPPNSLRQSLLATVSPFVVLTADQPSPLAPYKGKLMRKLTLQECCRETFHREWNHSTQRHCDSVVQLTSNTHIYHSPAKKRDDLHGKGQRNLHGVCHKNSAWQWQVLQMLEKVLVTLIVSEREGERTTSSCAHLFILLVYVVCP